MSPVRETGVLARKTRLCIDLGHPAHVHYSRELIRELVADDTHEVLVVARDRAPIHELLRFYQIPFVSRGTGSSSAFGKIAYIVQGASRVWRANRKFEADIFMGFGSFYAAHVAAALHKPSIMYDDTEHAHLGRLLYAPFTTRIVTPASFRRDLGKKHHRLNGFFELAYLHPSRFRPDPNAAVDLGLKPGDPFALIRFVDWTAYHDIGKQGILIEEKRKLVQTLADRMPVFISSETALPDDLKAYELKAPPHRIHHLLAASSFFFCESGTMASEAALLGVPTVHVSYVAERLGNFLTLRDRFGLIELFTETEKGLEASKRLMEPGTKQLWQSRRDKMLSEVGDVTSVMKQQLVDTIAEYTRRHL